MPLSSCSRRSTIPRLLSRVISLPMLSSNSLRPNRFLWLSNSTTKVPKRSLVVRSRITCLSSLARVMPMPIKSPKLPVMLPSFSRARLVPKVF
ncbi:Protein disulfide-isomerase [Daphnia magna]|uniref:Protein disulfide-isomerase n=1 Tax=Daphnia magna TaxID=35525 RepID=A0A162BS06_9CRUS|nr:Protein disulfide-isomerase [Daphnia magna]